MTPQSADLLPRAGTVIEILSGAIGLGAYIALAGGMAEWARMSGAGLPASQALSTLEPITLLASGFQTLLLVPVTLGFVMIVGFLGEIVGRSPREPRTVAYMRRGWRGATQLLIAGSALVVSVIAAFTVLSLVVLMAGDVAWLVGVAVITTVAVPVVLWVGVLRPAGRKLEASGLKSVWRDVAAAVPPVVRVPTEHVAFGRGGLWVVLFTVLTSGCVGLLAWGIHESWLRRANPYGLPDEVFLGGFLVLTIVFAAALLLLVGASWLRVAARERAEEDEAEEQANLGLVLAGMVLVGAALTPLSLGVLMVLLGCTVVFVMLYPTVVPNSFVRHMAASFALALGFVGYQAHSPQRFDRLDFSVSPVRGEKPVRLRVALIGTQNDAYVVAACDRVPFNAFGEKMWKSTRPGLLRFPIDDAMDAEIVSRKYAFAQPSSPTIVGALLSVFDISFPKVPTYSNRKPFVSAFSADVCGGVNNSGADARKAVRELATASR